MQKPVTGRYHDAKFILNQPAIIRIMRLYSIFMTMTRHR